MIEFIKGRLIDKDPTHVVVETGGVGYGLDISIATYQELPSAGEECELYTLLYVREDTFRLFGFATPQERDIFEVLIATSGIGPKLGLAILSNMPIEEFARAIAIKDISTLTQIPAIGKKTAERLCVELKDKLNYLVKSAAGKQIAQTETTPAGPIEEAISALIALGVKPAVAGSAINKASRVLGEDASVQELIKEGLKYRK